MWNGTTHWRTTRFRRPSNTAPTRMLLYALSPTPTSAHRGWNAQAPVIPKSSTTIPRRRAASRPTFYRWICTPSKSHTALNASVRRVWRVRGLFRVLLRSRATRVAHLLPPWSTDQAPTNTRYLPPGPSQPNPLKPRAPAPSNRRPPSPVLW